MCLACWVVGSGGVDAMKPRILLTMGYETAMKDDEDEGAEA